MIAVGFEARSKANPSSSGSSAKRSSALGMICESNMTGMSFNLRGGLPSAICFDATILDDAPNTHSREQPPATKAPPFRQKAGDTPKCPQSLQSSAR